MARYSPYEKRRKYNPVQDSAISSTSENMEYFEDENKSSGVAKESTPPLLKTIKQNLIQSIEINYFHREWVEFTNNLHFFPFQSGFNNFLPLEFIQRVSDANIGKTSMWLYCQPYVKTARVSNTIVLSDNISTGTGVNEVSSFVQNHKLLHFKVKPDKIGNQYFFMAGGKLITGPARDSPNTSSCMEAMPIDSINDVKISGVYDYHPSSTKMIDSMSTNIDQGRFLFKVSPTPGTNTDPNVVIPANGRSIDNFNMFKNYDCALIDSGDVIELYKPKFQMCGMKTNKMFSEASPPDAILKAGKFEVYTTNTSSGGTKENKGYYAWAPILKNFGPRTINSASNDLLNQQLRKQLSDSAWHDYITMVPIKKTDGSLMKLRCNAMIEYEMGIKLIMSPRAMGQHEVDNDAFIDFLSSNNDISPGVVPNLRGLSLNGIGTFAF